MAVQPRWRSDLSKVVITSNFEIRGWLEAEGDDDWDIYWASVNSTQQIFGPCSSIQLRPGQLLNHFPNHFELTRKDLLVKNINRYQRHARKSGGVPPIIPPTFVLPQDYALFVEEFRKHDAPGTTFILKPNSKAQGKGIFLINKLSQVRQRTAAAAAAAEATAATPDGKTKPAGSIPPVFLPSGSKSSNAAAASALAMRPALEHYVVSRYIENPLLVLGGNKFDLRLYVLVPSYQPLVVYMSSLGFARFSNVRYTREVAELDNQFVHLTNVAVQKEGGTAYNSRHGNKWPLQDLQLHLEATRGHAATTQLFVDIQSLVIHTLKAVQPVMINDHHCFELYGFDVIIDENMQPWLIEVNASPSMTSTTAADRKMKWQIIHDSLSVVTPQSWATAAARPASSSQGKTGSSCSGVSSKGRSSGRGEAAQQQKYLCAVGCMQLIHQDEQKSTKKTKRKLG